MAEFSERLKELREARGGTQKQISKELGLTLRAYQLYEYNEGFPTYKKLLYLADYFDVSLDYLVGRSEVRERR